MDPEAGSQSMGANTCSIEHSPRHFFSALPVCQVLALRSRWHTSWCTQR
jgi:hypothetical protein